MKPITIIGAGLAGYTVAREFRKLDRNTALTIVTADDGGFYSKPMLSNAFAQNRVPAQLVTQTAAQMAAQLNVQVLTGMRVDGIDSIGKTITGSAGKLEYGKLVIAVGAQAIRLNIDGDAADQILSINNVADYAIFRSRIVPSTRIAILGAGLIGCEFADDLAGVGHAVTLIDPNPLPLAALAAPVLSQGLQKALEVRGIRLRLGTTAARIDGTSDGLRIVLADGAAFDADIVLSAVGLRPDLTLAKAAHLSTGRGILIDAFGQTSAPDVYALGDCAEYRITPDSTQILPYIAPMMTAARAIARTLSGEPAPIEIKPAPVIVKTPCYPLALVPPPMQAGASGQWHAEIENGRTICRFYDAQGMLAGFGVAPQEAAVRQSLLVGLGMARQEKPLAAVE